MLANFRKGNDSIFQQLHQVRTRTTQQLGSGLGRQLGGYRNHRYRLPFAHRFQNLAQQKEGFHRYRHLLAGFFNFYFGCLAFQGRNCAGKNRSGRPGRLLFGFGKFRGCEPFHKNVFKNYQMYGS